MNVKKITSVISDAALENPWFRCVPRRAPGTVETIPAHGVEVLSATDQPPAEQGSLPPYPRFFELFRFKLLWASMGVWFSLLALYLLGDLISQLGVVQPYYFGLILLGLVTSALLPVHWLLRHRRMREVWNGDDGSDTSDTQPELRPVWRRGTESAPEVLAANTSQF